MFIGHYAVGFGARAAAPRPSLGTWFLAVQWLDVIWPPFVLLGWEQVRIDPGNTTLTPLDFVHYPYSHSLLAAALWGAVFALVYRLRRGGRWAPLGLWGAVMSHWVLDWLTHRPDLPLYPGGTVRVGLGLWNHPVPAVVLEAGLFIVGLGLYLRTTRARDRTGRYALWALVALLLVVYVGNLFAPPPPNATAVAISALALWLLVPWAYWIDRHRTGR